MRGITGCHPVTDAYGGSIILQHKAIATLIELPVISQLAGRRYTVTAIVDPVL